MSNVTAKKSKGTSKKPITKAARARRALEGLDYASQIMAEQRKATAQHLDTPIPLRPCPAPDSGDALREMLAQSLGTAAHTIPGQQPRFARQMLGDIEDVLYALHDAADSDMGTTPGAERTLFFLARLCDVAVKLDDDAHDRAHAARRAAKGAA